ncbi:MAG: radical SAM protein [bacterium]
MSELERVHWFLREECNLKRCAYCFGPLTEGKADPDRDVELAKVLVENGVRKVILGGGEPTLARNLEEVLQVLKGGGISVSLHTNGLLLTDERLDRWKGLVDDIALPFDAVDKMTQRRLRGKDFMGVFENLTQLADKINSRGIGLGWHTVFTRINRNEIPEIYKIINEQRFSYWRIYEYNTDLARQAWLTAEWLSTEDRIRGFLKSQSLEKLGTAKKGGTDCLLADFLRIEEEMGKLMDSRVTFVARLDSRKEPYSFLTNDGRVDYYAWYSDKRRKTLGNVQSDGFMKVAGRWQKVREHDEFDEDDWLETTSATPLWARLDDGIYFTEEVEEVLPKYIPEMVRLADLWQERNE